MTCLVQEGRETCSCLRLPRSSFIFTSSLSTSLRRVTIRSRIAEISFREPAVCSARSFDSAARKRYACYECMSAIRHVCREFGTLSKSFLVSPSLFTLLNRSMSKPRVAHVRLRATGVGKVRSSAAKNAWVWKGGGGGGRGGPCRSRVRDMRCTGLQIWTIKARCPIRLPPWLTIHSPRPSRTRPTTGTDIHRQRHRPPTPTTVLPVADTTHSTSPTPHPPRTTHTTHRTTSPCLAQQRATTAGAGRGRPMAIHPPHTITLALTARAVTTDMAARHQRHIPT